MAYFLRRLRSSVGVLVGAATAIFLMLHLSPGDPAVILAGDDASAAQVATVRHQLGLAKPLSSQFVDWWSGLARGDLGTSFTFKRPIADLIAANLGGTIQLAVTATVIMIVFGTLLGVLAAAARGRWTRNIVDLVSTAALSTPPFVSSIVMIFLFAVTLPLLPSSGESNFLTDPSVSLQYVIMPAIAVALPGSAVIGRLLATEMRRAAQEEFVRTAVSKGASRRRVLLRHVLLNSLGPAVVELGIRVGDILGGAVVVESLFARSGIGTLLVNSVRNRDYPLAQTLLLLSITFAIVMQLLAELSMSRIDRRLIFGGVRA